MLKSVLFLAAGLMSAAAAAQELLLAPGRSVTILDAADPSVRVVITAPPDAPLDLGALLTTDPKDNVYSIITRMQLNQAGRLSISPDGSMSLSAPLTAQAGQAKPMLEGGVLVFNAGRYVLHPAPAAQTTPTTLAEPQSPATATLSAENPGNPRLFISRPGVSREQAERDIRQCRIYAEQARAQFLRAADKAAMYNNTMRSCLKGFGYEIHAPAA